MQIFIVLIVAYGWALMLTPIVQWLSLQWDCGVDRPNLRKIHAQPKVRLGGVAIALTLGLTLLPLVLNSLRSQISTPSQFWGLLLGALGFFVIGVADDLFSLSPFHRLGYQMLLGTIGWFCGIQLTALPMPGWGIWDLGLWSLPLTLIWLAGIANAINWLDGMDGLASSIVIVTELIIFSLLMLTRESFEICWFCLAVVGATLGFLYHNAHPARLFMGDGGSYLLGFSLAATSLLASTASIPAGSSAIGSQLTASSETIPITAVYLPFVLLALPILDMSRVILGRLRAGHSPFYPDRSHIHHWLLDCGFSQRETVALIVSLSCCLSSITFPLAGIDRGELVVLGTGMLMLLQWMSCLRCLSERMASPSNIISNIEPFPPPQNL